MTATGVHDLATGNDDDVKEEEEQCLEEEAAMVNQSHITETRGDCDTEQRE